jgi:dTDP-4-dehydrorhamnose reductase
MTLGPIFRERPVLVTGAAGQLGTFIVDSFSDCHVVAPSHATLDITNAEAVMRTVAELTPAVIVNCAAYNDVDAAEDAPIDAMAANAFGVRTLARAAESCGATLVHYSTDFVFDGDTTHAYGEADAPSPRSSYAASKLLGEWFALDAPRAFVLRVESLFGSPAGWTGRRGTLGTLVDGLRDGREVHVFTDRVVSPSYCPDVAAATRYLLEANVPVGTYHCVNSGQATWMDVAQEAARILGLTPRLQPITMDQFVARAARPRFCALSNRKLGAAGFTMPTWQDAVRRWLAN